MHLAIWFLLTALLRMLFLLGYLACIAGIVVLFILRLKTFDVKKQKTSLTCIILLAVLWLVLHILAIIILFGTVFL